MVLNKVGQQTKSVGSTELGSPIPPIFLKKSPLQSAGHRKILGKNQALVM